MIGEIFTDLYTTSLDDAVGDGTVAKVIQQRVKRFSAAANDKSYGTTTTQDFTTTTTTTINYSSVPEVVNEMKKYLNSKKVNAYNATSIGIILEEYIKLKARIDGLPDDCMLFRIIDCRIYHLGVLFIKMKNSVPLDI